MSTYSWGTDSKDYVYFYIHNGDLAVSEDGSSERTIRLTKKAALRLAARLIEFGESK